MSMNSSSQTSSSTAGLHVGFFSWALALATGLEYFDNSIFSFFTSYIAGGINASPDELVWSTTAYATAAVLGILQQQWWVERMGYRRYVGACLLLYAAGAVLAALCETSVELACARGLQGYFIGPIMGASRILIRVSLTSKERPVATRAFLTLIVLSSALAPLVGGLLLSYFGWSVLFACTAPAGVLFAVLALLALPDSGYLHPELRGEPHLLPWLIFAFAQGALQIVMQQVRFERFSNSPRLPLLALTGIVLLGWFIWHQWHHPRPLVRLRALQQKAFRAGLILYVFYYYVSQALSYLIARFLESGLDYPPENAGRMVGITSLISSCALYAYFRYSSRLPHKKWIIVPGFALAIFIAFWMTQMPPDVSRSWLIVPMLLRGLLLLFIVVPVANVTFGVFPAEEFTHVYRLKNIVRQLTFSFTTATVIIVEQHRFALHQTRLVEFANPFNPLYQQTLAGFTRAFELLGYVPSEAHGLALIRISQIIARQASFLSSLDGFYFLIGVAVCGGLFAIWQKQID